ncbi:MAG: flagellar protein FlaG [Desulfobulbus sp.]|jgi:flagellar protein FlaG|uniref:flagellar protein FlaG n=1 Tax=Desulfobulbus sp. TaxID=895 RepID=UPI00284B1B2C|nr:flagellar protein FlaG [Desulfobulbus sp.]MDR2550735.1 flagellar protein FlaG [Desulfobulbus sp.]
MFIDNISTNAAGLVPRVANQAAAQVERDRRDVNRAKPPPQPDSSEKSSGMQPEELLDQIKSLTENGAYSVRFEKDQLSEELVVKIVDRESDEVIRQIPSEELLHLHAHLQELRGNIIDMAS